MPLLVLILVLVFVDTVGAQVLNVQDFGASPLAAGETNTAAIQAAINALPAPHGGVVQIPEGTYQMGQSTGLSWTNKAVILRGIGAGRQHNGATRLVFPAGVNWGISAQNGVNGGGGKSRIEDLYLLGSASAVVPDSDGIRVSGWGVVLYHVTVEGFGGNGVRIGTGFPSLSPPLNASSCLLIGVTVWRNRQNGLYVDGADSNVCAIIGLDSSENGQWGVYENGWLGNTYVAPHVRHNGLGSYRIGDISRNNIFLGAYAENDGKVGIQFDEGGAGGNVFIGSAVDNPIVDSTSRTQAFPNILLLNGHLRLTKPPSGRSYACWETNGRLSVSSHPCSADGTGSIGPRR